MSQCEYERASKELLPQRRLETGERTGSVASPVTVSLSEKVMNGERIKAAMHFSSGLKKLNRSD